MVEEKVGLKCTGCSACSNICPTGAIRMSPTKEGFLFPIVNEKLCIQCKMCVNVCTLDSEQGLRGYFFPEVYAARNKDDEKRLFSTSGGVFVALAEMMIEKGGYVVGAYYDKDFNVRHKIINDNRQIKDLMQSKYVQSDLNDVFFQVKKLLEENSPVLFCGTPCQSAGLQRFLSKEYLNLYCCDFICRGVISPKVYRKFLKDMSIMHKADVESVQFKNKDFGWNGFTTKVTFSNGKVYQKSRIDDYYMIGYLKHNLYLRPCCHECDYKRIPRISDLSLGDFWGIGEYKTELDDNKGTSVVLSNSLKGKILMDEIRGKLDFEKRSLEEVVAGNECVYNSAKKGKYRDYFFAHVEHVRFDTLIKRIEKKASQKNFKPFICRCLDRLKKIRGV